LVSLKGLNSLTIRSYINPAASLSLRKLDPKVAGWNGFSAKPSLSMVWWLQHMFSFICSLLTQFIARARRYTSPDEYPFSPDLPKPVLAPINIPQLLWPNDVNVNPKIFAFYIHTIVPMITRNATEKLEDRGRLSGNSDDDGNYGSAATIDVEVLQAISKRVHYGW
jgi:monofunctional chorismate mutase